jgi:hypothetical protein
MVGMYESVPDLALHIAGPTGPTNASKHQGRFFVASLY